MKRQNTQPAFLLFLLLAVLARPLAAQTTDPFQMRVVTSGLSHPWEITWGPDNMLWVTEARAYTIDRIDPVSGAHTVLADLSNKRLFPQNQNPWPQGGLMGLVLHPDLLDGKPYVYTAYVYRFDSCATGNNGCFFKSRVVRYTYNPAAQTLTDEQVLVDTIPGSSDHNGGRLAIATIGGAPYLFYTVGDMGAGHQANGDRPHRGQIPEIYEGKILRFNLEPDADAGAFDRWIPNNNPFNSATRQSAVYTLGHRNPQGLVFAPNGILYESEHGPYSDDELNLVTASANYGFPLVAGFADGNYNGLAVGAGAGVPGIGDEAANALQLGPTYRDPLASFWPAPNDTLLQIWLDDVNNTPPYPNDYLFWPTIAPAGIDYYSSTAIGDWTNSLLVTSLKLGRLYRVPLSANGQSVAGPVTEHFVQVDRYRDLAISPDGLKIYIATDSVGQIRGAAPGQALQPTHRGAILEFSYTSTSAPTLGDGEDVRLFPNPVSQVLAVDYGVQSSRPVQLKVYNALGLPVWQLAAPQAGGLPLAVDVARWPAGAYVMAVELEGGKTVMRRFAVAR